MANVIFVGRRNEYARKKKRRKYFIQQRIKKNHLTEDEVFDLLEGVLPEDKARELRLHLFTCPACIVEYCSTKEAEDLIDKLREFKKIK